MTTSASNDAPHKAGASSKAEARIAAIGLISVALYIVNFQVQRSIFNDASPSGLMWQSSAYAAITLALFSGYLAVLAMCARGQLLHGRTPAWALLVPVIVHLMLLPGRPWLSQDVFSYMAHGFLAVAPGSNPFLEPAEAAADMAIGPGLAGYGWHGQIGITPYGIVWTWIEKAVMRVSGEDLALALVLFKSVVVAASLGTAFFIWSFLGRTDPSLRLFGTLAYLWNPMILAEFAGEGHNDAVIIFFVIATLAACAARRSTASMVAQAAGILTKYISLMFCPAQLIYLWRTRRGTIRLALEIAAALLITGVIAAVLYGHLWAGSQTFDGLLRRGQPISSAAPFGIVNWLLRRSPLASFAAPLTVACVMLPLLALVAWVSWRVRDAVDLARAFAWISLGYVLVASPDYWPWYACMPVALIITSDTKRLLWLVILMSLTARLTAPLDVLRDHGVLGMIAAKGLLTGLGATLPLAVLLIGLYQRWRSDSRAARA